MSWGPKFYALRLVKEGPRIPAKVWRGQIADPDTGELLDRGERWQAELNGIQVDTYAVIIELDGVTGEPVVKGEVIAEDEYKYLLSVRDWAQNNPNAPEANPRRAIDHLKTETIF